MLREVLSPQDRVAVMGIGNELRGDDAAGLKVIRKVRELLKSQEKVLLLEGGIAPENFTGPLRRFNAQVVLLVDAAEMGEKPGTIRLVDWRETSGFSASTHTLPPYVLAEYLTADLNCQVYVLGIQPESIEWQNGLSTDVTQAVDMAAARIVSALS